MGELDARNLAGEIQIKIEILDDKHFNPQQLSTKLQVVVTLAFYKMFPHNPVNHHRRRFWREILKWRFTSYKLYVHGMFWIVTGFPSYKYLPGHLTYGMTLSPGTGNPQVSRLGCEACKGCIYSTLVFLFPLDNNGANKLTIYSSGYLRK